MPRVHTHTRKPSGRPRGGRRDAGYPRESAAPCHHRPIPLADHQHVRPDCELSSIKMIRKNKNHKNGADVDGTAAQSLAVWIVEARVHQSGRTRRSWLLACDDRNSVIYTRGSQYSKSDCGRLDMLHLPYLQGTAQPVSLSMGGHGRWSAAHLAP